MKTNYEPPKKSFAEVVNCLYELLGIPIPTEEEQKDSTACFLKAQKERQEYFLTGQGLK